MKSTRDCSFLYLGGSCANAVCVAIKLQKEINMSNYNLVSYEQDGPVLVITLNQPEALNALTPPMEGELHAALEQGDRDESIRSIILTGAGRGFSSGYNISQNSSE